MFKNTFQSGFLSILYSIGYVRPAVLCDVELTNECRSKPLEIWDAKGMHNQLVHVVVIYFLILGFSEEWANQENHRRRYPL